MNKTQIQKAKASFIDGYDKYCRGRISKTEMIRLCIIPYHFFFVRGDTTYAEVYRNFCKSVTQDELFEVVKTCDLTNMDMVRNTIISYANDIFSVPNGKYQIKHLLAFFQKAQKTSIKYCFCEDVQGLGWGVNTSAYKVAYCLRNSEVFKHMSWDDYTC